MGHHPSAKSIRERGMPLRGCKVSVEVGQMLHAEALRTRRTVQFIVSSVLTFWYEDCRKEEEARKKRLRP